MVREKAFCADWHSLHGNDTHSKRFELHLDQRRSKYGPQAKSGPLKVFVRPAEKLIQHKLVIFCVEIQL